MSREIVIEQKVCDFAEAQGWLVRKMVYAGRRGCPDRFFFRGGKMLMIEFKRPGCKPDAVQEREHARLRAQGFRVHIIDSVGAGCELLV